jgi:hypothetical protein
VAALLLVLGPAGGKRAEGAIYWGENSGISRSNLDGSVVESPFIKPAYNACGLAVDSTHIYWTSSQENKIRRARIDGTAVEPDFISAAGETPCDLAVGSGHVYWVNKRFDTIGRARLDGSNVEPDFLSTQPAPCGVAVSPNAIYWTTGFEGKVWVTDIGGLNPPKAIVDHSPSPCDLALTSTNLYWADRDHGTVSRANLDGSAPLKLFSVSSYVSNIAVEGDYLYWVGSQSGIGFIGRTSLDGTQVNPAFLTGQEWPYALAADSLQVVPPVITPPEQSKITIGKLRRNQKNGSVTFPVDIYEEGLLSVFAGGARVTVLPEGIEGSASVQAGRKLIRISPTTKRGDGSRCVLKVFRNGGKVTRALGVSFYHSGKTPVSESRGFVLFNPRIQSSLSKTKRKLPPVTCVAPPPKKLES